MKISNLSLSVLPDKLAICHLGKNDDIPSWAVRSSFFSIIKTEDELSIVCLEDFVPEGTKFEGNWKAIKVEGKFDFTVTGVLASLINPLAEAKISIFALSTFNTDYILIKKDNIEKAVKILSEFCIIKY